MELLGIVVVNKDMEREDVADGVDGVVLGEERPHGGIVDGENRDGEPAIDVRRQVSAGQVLVEEGVFGVFGENAGDVVGVGGGGQEEEEG